VFSELQAATGKVDSEIDGTLNSIAIGAEHTFRPNTSLWVSYIFDSYDDRAYSVLSGKVQTIMIGISFRM
jgi:predicted porin